MNRKGKKKRKRKFHSPFFFFFFKSFLAWTKILHYAKDRGRWSIPCASLNSTWIMWTAYAHLHCMERIEGIHFSNNSTGLIEPVHVAPIRGSFSLLDAVEEEPVLLFGFTRSVGPSILFVKPLWRLERRIRKG